MTKANVRFEREKAARLEILRDLHTAGRVNWKTGVTATLDGLIRDGLVQANGIDSFSLTNDGEFELAEVARNGS